VISGPSLYGEGLFSASGSATLLEIFHTDSFTAIINASPLYPDCVDGKFVPGQDLRTVDKEGVYASLQSRIRRNGRKINLYRT
jgi:hypothetical protein